MTSDDLYDAIVHACAHYGALPSPQVYMLRCDLYDAIGLPAGPFDSFYVVAALGPHEQKSSYCSMNEGVVHFESSSPGKEGYYEQLEDIKV